MAKKRTGFMKFYETQAELAWGARLSASAWAVYIYLGMAADRKGGCWPSTRVIATTTRMDRASVFRSLNELEKAGLVRRVERPGRSTLYEVIPPDFDEGDPSHGCDGGVADLRRGGRTDATGLSITEPDPLNHTQQQHARDAAAAAKEDNRTPKTAAFRALSDIGVLGTARDELAATPLTPEAVRDTWRTWKAKGGGGGLLVFMLRGKANELHAKVNGRLRDGWVAPEPTPKHWRNQS